jgi:hypothetical protein
MGSLTETINRAVKAATQALYGLAKYLPARWSLLKMWGAEAIGLGIIGRLDYHLGALCEG